MSVPLLKSLNMDEVSMICEVVELKKFGDGDTIIRQGDAGHEFYIISSGQCIVRKSAGPGQPEAKVAELLEGSHFGELALLNDDPRAASVVAKGRCECLMIERAAFERLLGPCKEILYRAHLAYLSRATNLFSVGKGGVGLFFEELNGKHIVRRIISGGSAQTDGKIETGDICIAVGGRSVQGLSQQSLKDCIVGDVHSFVELTLESSAKKARFTQCRWSAKAPQQMCQRCKMMQL